MFNVFLSKIYDLMSSGVEFGKYILQTRNSKKILKIQRGVEPPNPPPLGTPMIVYIVWGLE